MDLDRVITWAPALAMDLDRVITWAPALAMEVASPSDRMTPLLKKIFQYLEAGSEEVWLVMPGNREVQIYTQTDVRTVRGTDELTSAMLPGFTMPVASCLHNLSKPGAQPRHSSAPVWIR